MQKAEPNPSVLEADDDVAYGVPVEGKESLDDESFAACAPRLPKYNMSSSERLPRNTISTQHHHGVRIVTRCA